MHIMEINGLLDSIVNGNNKGSTDGNLFVMEPKIEFVSKSTPMDATILDVYLQGNSYSLSYRDLLHASLITPSSFECDNYIQDGDDEIGYTLTYKFQKPFNSKNIIFR